MNLQSSFNEAMGGDNSPTTTFKKNVLVVPSTIQNTGQKSNGYKSAQRSKIYSNNFNMYDLEK